MVRTRSDALYTGITTDVPRRVAEHADSGRQAAKSLRSKGPLTLVYSAKIGQRGLALKVEHRLKRLPKAQKEALVRAQPGRPALIKTLQIELSPVPGRND